MKPNEKVYLIHSIHLRYSIYSFHYAEKHNEIATEKCSSFHTLKSVLKKFIQFNKFMIHFIHFICWQAYWNSHWKVLIISYTEKRFWKRLFNLFMLFNSFLLFNSISQFIHVIITLLNSFQSISFKVNIKSNVNINMKV